jgi:hypothetical protein
MSEQKPFDPASGSARLCEWLVLRGRRAALCPVAATHRDPETGALFCDMHADEYEDVFGGVLNPLTPNADLRQDADNAAPNVK